MRHTILIILLLWVSVISSAQKSWRADDYKTVTLKSYEKFALFNEQIDFDQIDYPRLHAAIFYATNEQRVKNGLSFLEYAAELEISAYNHSKNMVDDNFFSHTDKKNPGRETPNDRGGLAGIKNPYLAENIVEEFAITYKANTEIYIIDEKKSLFSYKPKGQIIPNHTYLSFAKQVVDDWMNSEGHRKNILSKDALQLGCGAYFYRDAAFYNMPKFKATQNFQLFEQISSTEPADKLPGMKN